MSSEARSFIERERETETERRFEDLKIEILSHAGYESCLIFNKFQWFEDSIPNDFRGTFLPRERERERERDRERERETERERRVEDLKI